MFVLYVVFLWHSIRQPITATFVFQIYLFVDHLTPTEPEQITELPLDSVSFNVALASPCHIEAMYYTYTVMRCVFIRVRVCEVRGSALNVIHRHTGRRTRAAEKVRFTFLTEANNSNECSSINRVYQAHTHTAEKCQR